MKNIGKQILFTALSVAMVLGLTVMPVSADHGGNDTTEHTTTNDNVATDPPETTSGSHDGTSGGSGSSNETETETELETDSGSHQSGKLHDEAQQLLSDRRLKVKEHTEAQRQKACEQRQKSIDKRTANFGAAAQRHLTVFNNVFTKVQAFHDSKGLNVANYDTLVATAKAKQTAAQAAVDALKALDVQIDCTQTDPASTVATIKTAVANARTALQGYRSAIKDVIVALKGASTSNDTTGGDQ